MPFAQEQEELRKEVSQAFHANIDAEDDLFVKRSEAGGSAGSYRDAVLASLGPDADEETIRKAIRRNEASTSVLAAEDRDEKKNEDFLLNYILNRGWIDTSSDARPSKPRLTKAALQSKDASEADPTPATGVDSQAYGRDWEAEAADLASESSFDSMADAFETAYNFRFEDPNALTIPTYSRQPKDSARREDNTRKRKREERAARKDEERRAKMQELSRLKNLKRQEIVDKLKKLREVTGSSTVDFEGMDLEGDFDPEEHDRAMEKAFGDGYYGEEDGEKPSWEDDIDIDDIIREHEASTGQGKGKKKAKQTHDGDEDRIEMDADFLDDATAAGDATAGGSKEAALRARLADKKLSKKERKKLKKKLKSALSKSSTAAGNDSDSDANDDDDGVDISTMDADTPNPAPGASATDKKAMAKEMIDSYYNLDYEDMIGDLPTRFKYTQVAPPTTACRPWTFCSPTTNS